MPNQEPARPRPGRSVGVLVGSLIVVATLVLASCAVTRSGEVGGGEPSGVGTPTAGPAAAPAPDEVVFIWSESGGCFMVGPNCARYEVRQDGSVWTYRQSPASAAPSVDIIEGPVATGTVDRYLVSVWNQAVATTDLDALRDRVGPGELTAAFDGIDHEVSAPEAGWRLSSVEVRFADGEELFDAARALAQAAADAAPLPLQSR